MSATLSDAKEQIRNMTPRPEARVQARDVAFRAIQKNPADAEIRLMLAKLFYLDGLFEFAARELIEVQLLQPTPSVERLLDQFAEYATPFISRLKSMPRVSGGGTPVPQTSASGTPEKDTNEDEVVADLHVDLDLFEES